MRIVPKSRGHAPREVVIPTCFFRDKQQNSKRSRTVAKQSLAISDGILLRGKECQLEHSARVSLLITGATFCIEPCIRLPENSGAQVQNLRLDASLKGHR